MHQIIAEAFGKERNAHHHGHQHENIMSSNQSINRIKPAELQKVSQQATTLTY
jgi:hypothetical protein